MNSFPGSGDIGREPDIGAHDGYLYGPSWLGRPLGRALLGLVLIDLLLGGNGYLIDIGGFRVREVLFPLCLLWAAARLTVVEPIRLPKAIWAFLAFFFATTLLAVLVGYFGGSRVPAIIAELKPLSYFLMLPFFMLAIRTFDDISFVARLVVICAMILALAYLLLLAAAYLGFLDYGAIYEFLRQSDEFIFRHNPAYGTFVGFLYKGMFNVCLAVIFFLLDPYRSTKISTAILTVAVALTMTRGFVVALPFCLIAALFLHGNWRRAPIVLAHIVLMILIVYKAIGIENQFLIASGDRPPELSLKNGWGIGELARPEDQTRTKDLRFILNNVDASMLLVGRGLGAPIGERERIEMTYPELLYKQGIWGLALWVLLFLYSFQLYLKTPRFLKQHGLAFFICGMFVYVVTATNPFLTGSIGMSVVFIGISALSVLSGRIEAGPAEMVGELSWYRGKWLLSPSGNQV